MSRRPHRSRRKPFRIRIAGRQDVEAIARLARELYIHERDPIEHFTADAVLRDGFGDAPQFEVLLAEIDGEAVGYALFEESYDTASASRGLYLCDLHVTGAARRSGIGQALVAAVARVAKARGKSGIWWEAKAWNDAAKTFYRSLGATEEPVLAYALSDDAFETLAEAGTLSDPQGK